MDGPHPYVKASILALIAFALLLYTVPAIRWDWLLWTFAVWWAGTLIALLMGMEVDRS